MTPSCIFWRLTQLGYGLDIEFSGRHAIRESRKSPFDICKSLTDKGWFSCTRYADSVLIPILEWDCIWPRWVKKMNQFRLRLSEKTVYHARRHSLIDKYDAYIHCPSPDTPSFELLTHVGDVARFPSLRDIIRAPEENQRATGYLNPRSHSYPDSLMSGGRS